MIGDAERLRVAIAMYEAGYQLVEPTLREGLALNGLVTLSAIPIRNAAQRTVAEVAITRLASSIERQAAAEGPTE